MSKSTVDYDKMDTVNKLKEGVNVFKRNLAEVGGFGVIRTIDY